MKMQPPLHAFEACDGQVLYSCLFTSGKLTSHSSFEIANLKNVQKMVARGRRACASKAYYVLTAISMWLSSSTSNTCDGGLKKSMSFASKAADVGLPSLRAHVARGWRLCFVAGAS